MNSKFWEIEEKIKKIKLMKEVKNNFNEPKQNNNINKINVKDFQTKIKKANSKINELKDSLNKYNKKFQKLNVKPLQNIVPSEKELSDLNNNLKLNKKLHNKTKDYVKLLNHITYPTLEKPSKQLLKLNIKNELKIKNKIEQESYKLKLKNLKLI